MSAKAAAMGILSAIALAFSAGSYATDLVDVYKLAQKNDSRFSAARNEYMAARQALPQAKATYRPNVTLQAETIRTQQEILSSDNEVFGVGKTDFSTDTYNLVITQPIFRYSNLAQIKQARAQVHQAEASFKNARQDLLLRVATAYIGVLAAYDGVELSNAEKKAVSRQLALASKRLDIGLGTVTDLHEAKARFELTTAQAIEAENTLEDSLEALRETTGVRVANLTPLRGNIPLVTPDPPDIKRWVAAAMARNPSLGSQRQALRAARLEIRRQVGQHYPTLDLVGTHGRRNAGGSLFGGGSEVETSDVTLRLAIPLYEGGATVAKTKEARYKYGKTLDELELQRRMIRRQTQAAFLGVISGISKVKALRESVTAQQLTLAAKAKGFSAGVNTNLDVLDAQRDLYLAKRDFYKARYDYLLSILQLKQAAGTLWYGDLVEMNRVLAGEGNPDRLVPRVKGPQGASANPAPAAAGPRAGDGVVTEPAAAFTLPEVRPNGADKIRQVAPVPTLDLKSMEKLGPPNAGV